MGDGFAVGEGLAAWVDEIGAGENGSHALEDLIIQGDFLFDRPYRNIMKSRIIQ